jgi:hypothetical protein
MNCSVNVGEKLRDTLLRRRVQNIGIGYPREEREPEWTRERKYK